MTLLDKTKKLIIPYVPPKPILVDPAKEAKKKESDELDLIDPNVFMAKGPGVYKLSTNKDGVIEIRKDVDFYILPKKTYGNLEVRAKRFFLEYFRILSSLGCLFTGSKGTGKSETAKIVANLAILNGMPVLEVTGIRGDLKLINYLDKIKNAVLFMDEFEKNFPRHEQNKMLTLLSDFGNKNRLTLLTANSTNQVSSLLLDRPGRLRYHLAFGKLMFDIVKEFCKDEGATDEFIKELAGRYDSVVEFSFDQLAAIVTEHVNHKDETLNELIEILNVKSLFAPLMMHAIEVIKLEDVDKKNKGKVNFKIDSLKKDDFLSGRKAWGNLPDEDSWTSFNVGKEHVTSTRDGKTICIVDNKYKITFEEGRN